MSLKAGILTFAAVGIVAMAATLGPAAGQGDYPNKTVTLIVPYPPGGGVDVLGRVVAEKLSAALGQQVTKVFEARRAGPAHAHTFSREQ